MSSKQIAAFSRTAGTFFSWMRSASPSTIAVLPTPGSPTNTGLFFRRRCRTWIVRLDLGVAADGGVDEPLRRGARGGSR